MYKYEHINISRRTNINRIITDFNIFLDYGDPCMTLEDCTLVLNDSFECRKNICQCPTDYEYKDEYCQRSGSLQLVAGYLTIMFCALRAVALVF